MENLKGGLKSPPFSDHSPFYSLGWLHYMN